MHIAHYTLHKYRYKYIYIYLYLNFKKDVYIYVNIHVYIYIYIYIYIHKYVYIYIHIHTYTYTYTYTNTYTYTYTNTFTYNIAEGSLEIELPTIWKMEKQRREESRRRRQEVRRSEKRNREKNEDAGARQGRKVATFPSQNVQNTPGSDHFWKFRCRKSARRCGAKHISKSKCTKHTNIGPLLELEMSKKCTPLWREAHFQVKMYKTHQLRTTLSS